MYNSTKIAMFILVVVVVLGEMGKDEGEGFAKIKPLPERSASLPPVTFNPPSLGEGLDPISPNDPIITIADEAKGSRSQYTGTAFSIDQRGLWITARHVTNGCDQLLLLRPHRRALPVKGLSEHNRADVALLQTDGGYNALAIDGSVPQFEQEGFHYGFPRGEPGDVYSTLLGRRVIKSKGTRNTKEPVLVWAERIRVPDSDKTLGGISGGPILNKDGNVVGVHIAGSVRRGRSFSSLPKAIGELLNRHNVDLNVAENNVDISLLNSRDFSNVGNSLRRDVQVAQVICRTN